MAGHEPSTTRRHVLGAAAALPIVALIPAPAASVIARSATTKQSSPAAEIWNRHLARYHRLAVRAKQAAESGWFRAANDRHARDIEILLARFGSWEDARLSPEGAALCVALWQRLDEAEETYWERCILPIENLAVVLALTPAPDVDALIAKLQVIREQKLEESDRMPRRLLDVLEEDLARLRSPFSGNT